MSLLYTILSVVAVCCAFALLVMHYAKPLVALPHKEFWVLALVVIVFILYMAYLMMPFRSVGDEYARYTESKVWLRNKQRKQHGAC